jgi:zinc protease
MKRHTTILLVTTISFAALGPARADDQDAKSILDKAIKALGGEEKLTNAAAHSWKANVKLHFGGGERDVESHVTASGLDHFRREFNSPQFTGILVIDGEKGWRKRRDETTELDADSLANEKRSAYLQLIPVTLMPLKDKGFKLEAAGAEKVDGKPAVVLKVTAPDGKNFTLFFDKESGLPVKEVATMTSPAGQEFSVESTFLDYKDMGGIKKATRIEVKSNGEPSSEMEITEFKILDKVDPETFAEPK